MYSEDLTLKGYSERTIKNYVSQVNCFLSHFDKIATKPSEINERQIKEWLLLANTRNSRSHRISALKLFYKLTGKQPLKFKYIEYPRKEQKLPVVLSVAEVQRMFDACDNTKHRVVLALLYSVGLRVSELINLKWQHIDRSRMIINIIAAKGKKDRQAMLTPSLIPLLEKYWHEYRSKVYVLNGQSSMQYSQRSVLQVVKHLAATAGINKSVWSHLIRHCTFTHMLEGGTDLSFIQRIAGHSNIKTTAIYCHISHNLISRIVSPLSAIAI